MILTDDKTAVMELHDFEHLKEYSSSVPTSPSVGRQWKRRARRPDGEVVWWYAETLPDDDPAYVRIKWRRIYVA